MIDWLPGVVGGLVLMVVGITVRRNNVKMDKLEDKSNKAMYEPRARQLIEDKLGPLKVQYGALNRRMDSIEGKIDKLLDLHLNGRK